MIWFIWAGAALLTAGSFFLNMFDKSAQATTGGVPLFAWIAGILLLLIILKSR